MHVQNSSILNNGMICNYYQLKQKTYLEKEIYIEV